MSTDSQLQQAVIDELGWEPSVISAHIGVTAAAGVVTLSGHVANFSQNMRLKRPQRRVKGVKAIAEEIEVRLPVEGQRSDQEIAAAAIDRMGWDVTIPKDTVKIQVQDGWVTLSGQVDWFYQKENAGKEVRHLFGVRGLSDHIVIKPRVDVANLSEDITHALHRSWFFDPRTIDVTATGGRVHLTGSVSLLHDKQMQPPPPGRHPASRAFRTISPFPSRYRRDKDIIMPKHDSLVAIYATHDAAETAIRQVSKADWT